MDAQAIKRVTSDKSGAFTARQPFEASHPSALALYCSDGRFTEAVEELFRHLGEDRLDTMTLPGGPGLLDSWTGGVFAATDMARSATFLIEAHHLKRIVLIAHEGCGFYRQRFGATGNHRERQISDLRTAAQALNAPHLRPQIDCYYASVVEGCVRFERV